MELKKIRLWTPRVLTILMILFISMFALDAFVPGTKLSDQVIGFMIHLIPSFFLILTLVLAWKFPRLGGWFFVAMGVLFTPGLFYQNMVRSGSWMIALGTVLVITLPLILIGVMFIFSVDREKEDKQEPSDE